MSFWNNRKKYSLLLEDANEETSTGYLDKYNKISDNTDSKSKAWLSPNSITSSSRRKKESKRISHSLNDLSDNNLGPPPPLPPRRPSKPTSSSSPNNTSCAQNEMGPQRFRNSFSVSRSTASRSSDSPLQYPPASILPVLHRNAMLRSTQMFHPETILWIPIGNENHGFSSANPGRMSFMGPEGLFNLFHSDSGVSEAQRQHQYHENPPPTYDEALNMEVPELQQIKQSLRFIRETSV